MAIERESSPESKARASALDDDRRFHRLFEAVPDALLKVDATGRIVMANAEASRLFGYPPEDLVGLSVEVLLPPRFRAAHPQHRAEAAVSTTFRRMGAGRDLTALQRDGAEIDVEISLGTLRDEGGMTLVIARDVTERKQSRDALQAAYDALEVRVAERTAALAEANARLERELSERCIAEELYRGLLHSIPSGAVALFDHDLRYVLAEGPGVHTLALGGVVGKTLREVAPALADELEPVYREVLSGRTVHEEVRGAARSLDVTRSPVRREDGRIIAGMILAHDVTERVAVERALRAGEERYRVLFERAHDGIFIADADGDTIGTIRDANPAMAAMYGLTVPELVGRHLMTLVADPSRTWRYLDQVRAGSWIHVENVHRRVDGSDFPVEVSAGTVELARGRAILCFVRDLTAHRRVEEALRQAKEAADQASDAKSSFLASMSHEIRTPMNAVLGYAQLLARDPALVPEHRRQVEIIQRSGDHLLHVINDVLELSKIEAGHRQLHRGPVDLTALLGDLDRMFRLRADGKGLRFTIDLSPDVPRHIVSDEGKLRQILANLVSNAVKFTEQGWVVVRVRSRQQDDGPWLVVEVGDTGPGLRPEELSRLFVPFVQARAGAWSKESTGLGLSLSRELARLMGGDITADSRPGEGSTFRVEVPFELGWLDTARRTPTPEAGRIVGLAEPSAVRVLIVDDDEGSRGWLHALLAEIGFEVREAETGAEAVEAVVAFQPQLVLMDMQMPVMDGYAATRALRAKPAGDGVIVLAVTASAFDDAREAIFAAGADGWLRKPCRAAEVLEQIRCHLGLTYRYEEQHVTALTPVQPLRIVKRLSPELAAAIGQAARIADYDRLLGIIDSLPDEHAALAEELRQLADRFAYDEVVAFVGA